MYRQGYNFKTRLIYFNGKDIAGNNASFAFLIHGLRTTLDIFKNDRSEGIYGYDSFKKCNHAEVYEYIGSTCNLVSISPYKSIDDEISDILHNDKNIKITKIVYSEKRIKEFLKHTIDFW